MKTRWKLDPSHARGKRPRDLQGFLPPTQHTRTNNSYNEMSNVQNSERKWNLIHWITLQCQVFSWRILNFLDKLLLFVEQGNCFFVSFPLPTLLLRCQFCLTHPLQACPCCCRMLAGGGFSRVLESSQSTPRPAPCSCKRLLLDTKMAVWSTHMSQIRVRNWYRSKCVGNGKD